MGKDVLHKTEPKTHEQSIRRKYRNYTLLLYFSIGGLSLMFLSLTFLYYLSPGNAQQPALKMAPLFYWNTLLLLGSSLIILAAQYHFKKDNFTAYKTSLLLLLGTGILFLCGQISAWTALFTSGYDFLHLSASYLYVISGLHALHILGGLIFLGFFMQKSWKMLENYATSVVYFTDPVAKSQLKLFGIFWHFLGVMWLYLLIFFIIAG